MSAAALGSTRNYRTPAGRARSLRSGRDAAREFRIGVHRIVIGHRIAPMSDHGLVHVVRRDPFGTRDSHAFAQAFEAARMGRAAAVQAASARMGRIYHLSAIPALARNLVLRARSSEALLKSYDWLYRFGDTD